MIPRVFCLLVAPVLAVLAFASSSVLADATHAEGRSEYRAPRADVPPSVDGVADEEVWKRAEWRELNYRWLGPELTAQDFKGRFKVVWTDTRLYILGEFADDVLFDSHRNPLDHYWDDDCVEIFLDEDFSGGDHQFNHSAFAYHVSLDNQSIDVGTDKLPHNYTDHVESRWQARDDGITWEFAIDVHQDGYTDGSGDNVPVTLSKGKVMGLMVAYCDNDGSVARENFIGSEPIPGDDKNRGWIDAGLFGALVLVETP